MENIILNNNGKYTHKSLKEEKSSLNDNDHLQRNPLKYTCTFVY